MSHNTTLYPGLCATCQHMQRIETRRGSAFYLCLRSQTDPAFAKYPPLPVRQCHGYQPTASEETVDATPAEAPSPGENDSLSGV